MEMDVLEVNYASCLRAGYHGFTVSPRLGVKLSLTKINTPARDLIAHIFLRLEPGTLRCNSTSSLSGPRKS